MPRVSFGGTRKVEGYQPIPDGQYLCSVRRIEETQTRKGDTMWKLRLEVGEGRHARRIVFDNLVFSQGAQERLEMFCRALRLPTTGEVDLEPVMVKDKACMVVVQTEDYQDNEGLSRTRNKVAYEGYLPVPRPDQVEAGDDDDLPF